MISVESRIVNLKDPTLASLSATELSFLQLLLSKGLLVWYEAQVFSAELNGKVSTTKPDFFVINPKNTKSKGKYVEITTAPCLPTNTDTPLDPKIRQRAVLKKNGATHVILYQHHLEKCQRYNPSLDFDAKNRRAKRKALEKNRVPGQ